MRKVRISSTFFQNGNLEEKGEMNGGLLQGEFQLYWPNGKIRQEKKFNLYESLIFFSNQALLSLTITPLVSFKAS